MTSLFDPQEERRVLLDPRTKLLALLVVNIVAYGRGSLLVPALAFVLVAALLATVCTPSGWLKFVILVPGAVLLGIYGPVYIPNVAVLLLGMIGYWTGRFALSIGMAYYVIKTTKVSEFVAALRAMKVPQVIVVPMTVMLRFIPTVFHELRAIVDAMRLRGVAGTGWSMAAHPLRTAEYIVVPLLATTTRISDDLAASGMLRGLARTGARTCVVPIQFRVMDGVMVVALGVIIAFKIFEQQFVI